MIKHPQITAITSILRSIQVITWADLKKVALPNTYKHQAELAKCVTRLERDGVVKIERDELGFNVTRFREIHYLGDLLPKPQKIVFKEKKVEKVGVGEEVKAEMMPCKVRVSKCYHAGCYLAEYCKIRPEYIYQEEDK